jgi:hypothetical protein
MAFVLTNLLSLGPVQGSSVTGLLATLVLLEKLALAASCGSFAGMARTVVIPGVALVFCSEWFALVRLHVTIFLGLYLTFCPVCTRSADRVISRHEKALVSAPRQR